MTTMVAKNDSGRWPAVHREPGTGVPADPAAVDSDEVVRPGDDHMKGVQGLCVGESQ